MLARDGCEALGPAWMSETEARWVRLVCTADKRRVTIPTVVSQLVSQLIVEGATERVVQGIPELKKDFVQLRAIGAPRAHARS